MEKNVTLEEIFMLYMQETNLAVKNNLTSIRDLEAQIGRLSNNLTIEDIGTLLRNTLSNLKEHIKAIALRSGRIIEQL